MFSSTRGGPVEHRVDKEAGKERPPSVVFPRQSRERAEQSHRGHPAQHVEMRPCVLTREEELQVLRRDYGPPEVLLGLIRRRVLLALLFPAHCATPRLFAKIR